MTDNKLVTRFFQTKAIPPSLWNACDYVLQRNFKIAHIAGLVESSWLSLAIRIESHGGDSSQNPGRCTKTPNVVTTSSSDVADEEQFFFAQADGENETEEETLDRKEQSQKKYIPRMAEKWTHFINSEKQKSQSTSHHN